MRCGWWNSLNVRIYQIFCSEESLEESGFILSVSFLTAMQLGRSSSLEISCGTDCGQIHAAAAARAFLKANLQTNPVLPARSALRGKIRDRVEEIDHSVKLVFGQMHKDVFTGGGI